MRNPPSPPPALLLPAAFASQGLSLRPASDADLAFERALFETARSDIALLAPWPDDVRKSFLDRQFHFQSVHYARTYPTADLLLVIRHTDPIGRLIVDRAGLEWVLVDIALLPDCRGRGLGRALLGSLLEAAARADASVFLTVEVHNRARALYERLGFLIVDESFPNTAMEWKPPGQLKTA